jgi:hypothetical protein
MGAGLAFRGAASLHKRLASLRIDGAEVALPHGTKAVLVLNIPSYGAGTHPWGDDNKSLVPCLPPAHHRRRFAPAAIDDGLLEVVALFGIVHAATLHAPRLLLPRLARGGGAKRLGQGGVIELSFRTAEQLAAAGVADKALSRPTLAAQSDGEAWAFESVGETVTLSLRGRVGAPLGPQHAPRGGFPHAHTRRECAGAGAGDDADTQQLPEGDTRRGAEVAGVQREPYV